MKRHGFLLIGLLLYIATSLLLILSLTKWSATIIKQVMHLNTRSFGLIRAYAACRALEYDLEQASCLPTAWLKTDEHKIQFINDSKRITWKLDGQQMKRTVADFDPKKERWRKAATVILADAISNIFFIITYDKNKQIDSINYQIKTQLHNKNTIQLEHTVWPMIMRIL